MTLFTLASYVQKSFILWTSVSSSVKISKIYLVYFCQLKWGSVSENSVKTRN